MTQYSGKECEALAAWVGQLTAAPQYDPQIESLVEVAEVLDRSYGRR